MAVKCRQMHMDGMGGGGGGGGGGESMRDLDMRRRHAVCG